MEGVLIFGLAALLLFCVSIKALKDGRVGFGIYRLYHGKFERTEKPVQYWLVLGFYGLGFLLCVYLAYGIYTGVFEIG